MLAGMTRTLVKDPPPGRYAGEHIDWSLLSSQGRVLFYIALCPGCGLKEIAHALGLTERTAWAIMRTLRDSGMIKVDRVGRKHSYRINLDAPLFVPSVSGFSLRDVLGTLVKDNGGHRSEQCLDVGNKPA